jgi:hypothetical protein
MRIDLNKILVLISCISFNSYCLNSNLIEKISKKIDNKIEKFKAKLDSLQEKSLVIIWFKKNFFIFFIL